MPTIASENLRSLREPMDVICGIDETPELPDSVTPNSTLEYDGGTYNANAKVTDIVPRLILMDLSSSGGENCGFLNDGRARPITTDPIDGKYGFISAEMNDNGGNWWWDPAPAVTIVAYEEWDYITLFLSDRDGNAQTRLIENPTWTINGDGNPETTVTISEWAPLERLYVDRVALGKAWMFDNCSMDNLISCTVSLRGVETKPDNPELQLSEIEIHGYEPTSYVDVIGRITAGAPIWYQAGYPGDMSAMRYFFLNDTVDWQDKVLTIRGYDATHLLDKEFGGDYAVATSANAAQSYFDLIGNIISNAGVIFSTVDYPPAGSGSVASNILIEPQSPRQIIANAVNLYRDPEVFEINYVDAGIPTLYAGPITRQTWSVNADQIADFTSKIELNINEVQSELQTVAISSSFEEIMQQEVVSGETYWIESPEPCSAFTTTLGSISYITPYKAIMTATSTGTASIKGKRLIISTTSGNDPYIVNNNEGGTLLDLDNQLLLPTPDGSITQDAMTALLDRSNVTFEFTYRGNPRMQPRDIINLTLLDGTHEIITIDTITNEHADGGLTAKITGRRGVI